MYTRSPRMFLNLIPNTIFAEYLGEPKSRDVKDLAALFTQLVRKDISVTKQVLHLINPVCSSFGKKIAGITELPTLHKEKRE